MPSSVFRCISVFQVYFGVYTDRNRACPTGDVRELSPTSSVGHTLSSHLWHGCCQLRPVCIQDV